MAENGSIEELFAAAFEERVLEFERLKDRAAAGAVKDAARPCPRSPSDRTGGASPALTVWVFWEAAPARTHGQTGPAVRSPVLTNCQQEIQRQAEAINTYSLHLIDFWEQQPPSKTKS